ncbi:hypothetical protein PTKIN_Ptkin19aG0082600 [Pterospermum kingtungense]
MELANTFAKRCGGLPLALFTVAGAMACRKNLSEWRHTVQLLHNNPSEIAQDYNIGIDEVIDLWIGEGFLDGPDPCDQGVFIVETLKLACLLESDESNQCVRMHDILCRMALWLARDQPKKQEQGFGSKNCEDYISGTRKMGRGDLDFLVW